MKREETARFDTTMSASHKLLLEEAARLKGFKNLTAYVLSTMVSDATEVIHHFKSSLYTVEDQKRIMEILNEPTVLTSSFKEASKRRNTKLNNELPNSTP